MKSDVGIEQLVKRARALRVSLLGPEHDKLASYDRESLSAVMRAMEDELLLRVEPDRELLIQTSALVCGENASRYQLGSSGDQVRSAVALARAIVREVDSEQSSEVPR